MANELTRRQAEVLLFIVKYIRDNNTPPTLREISSHLRVGSPVTAMYHIQALQRKGFVSRELPGQRVLAVHWDKVAEVGLPYPVWQTRDGVSFKLPPKPERGAMPPDPVFRGVYSEDYFGHKLTTRWIKGAASFVCKCRDFPGVDAIGDTAEEATADMKAEIDAIAEAGLGVTA